MEPDQISFWQSAGTMVGKSIGPFLVAAIFLFLDVVEVYKKWALPLISSRWRAAGDRLVTWRWPAWMPRVLAFGLMFYAFASAYHEQRIELAGYQFNAKQKIRDLEQDVARLDGADEVYNTLRAEETARLKADYQTRLNSLEGRMEDTVRAGDARIEELRADVARLEGPHWITHNYKKPESPFFHADVIVIPGIEPTSPTVLEVSCDQRQLLLPVTTVILAGCSRLAGA